MSDKSAGETAEFDYVIVGAVSAGCVLANRLSANGKHSVLLLEAGPKDSNIWIHVPIGYGKLFKEKTVNWMYQTEPEPGLHNRQVFQPESTQQAAAIVKPNQTIEFISHFDVPDVACDQGFNIEFVYAGHHVLIPIARQNPFPLEAE